ncbi:DNA glycosylase [Macrolepiota fuliginosa MF-IS2]|uniref:DNA glycosylase n=1 Tax=Macrolepiota fuliginosa MF-IS2 TaxID=1400762 RepID=A0A9P6C8M0_9AGAR|nr:DNA glycosylase [Macrolepiota fuliginosa MF-IS2]
MKRRAAKDAPDARGSQKKARNAVANTPISGELPSALANESPESSGREDTDATVPAVLTFSLDKAKEHLIDVDHRFEDIFNKVACKPYENLEQFHPFQALSTSILGQQISWLAARSIIHKFRRLYDPTLPEKPGEAQSNSFPTPAQITATDLSVLRSAGLSTRKAEYIQDLAKRFADGRLSTRKILSANDEELAEMLIEVRGIGRWTVDMFAIFSLRRPDILPVGDLGVQRGLAWWFLALHSPSDPFSISPEKISQSSTKKPETGSARIDNDDSDDEGYLPVIGETDTHNSGPSHSVKDQEVDGVDGRPPLFTPSISKTLRNTAGTKILPLPKTLSVAELRSRISGKKKVKGALLTPQEMEILTENWKPYRSIGVYYMWSLASAE